MPLRVPIVVVLAAALVAACTAAPGGVASLKRTTSKRAPLDLAPTAGPVAPPAEAAGNGGATTGPGLPGASSVGQAAGVPPANPAETTPGLSPVASLPAATLIGKVKAPATLLSNNGGNLVGNNAGGYRLLAGELTQVPVASATVTLQDARGRQVLGADGQPLTTTTDSTGAYAFRGPLPPYHVVVTVAAPGAQGPLTRVVAPGVQVADVEYASTLVAAYVVDRYVKSQPDPQATLNKLPPPIEAETVALAAQAAAGAPAAVSLTASSMVLATESLRKANPGFDAQLEMVRKILISAGVSNLGTGLPATEVYMRRLFASDVAADGALYSYASDDHLLWRVGPEGRLGVAAGNGEQGDARQATDRDGLKPTAVSLDHLWAVQVDAAGRPMVSENEHGIWRLEPAGLITQLHRKADLEAAFGGGFLARSIHLRPDGTLVTLHNDAIWSLKPGDQVAERLAAASGARAVGGLTELPGGKAWLVEAWGSLTKITAGAANTTLFAQDDPRITPTTNLAQNTANLDARGNFFYVARADGQVHVLRPDGTDTALTARSRLKQGLAWSLQGADGKVYLSDCNMGDNLGTAIVRRLAGGEPAIVAGVDGLPRGFTSDGRIPLAYPKGMDVAPDGTLYLADNGNLLKIPPGGPAELLGARDTLVGPFTPVQFSGVRRLPDGTLVARALSKPRELIVRQDGPGGTWKVVIAENTAWGNPWNVSMHAWDVAPDGTIVVSQHVYNTQAAKMEVAVWRLRPGEPTASILVPAAAGLSDIARLVFAPDGTLHLRGGKGFTDPDRTRHFLVGEDGTLSAAPPGRLAAEARDAQGRLYEGDASAATLGNYGDRKIRRQAPGAAAEVVAGQGTALLGGDALDDSIGWAEDLRFDAAGNLYVRDVLRRQVRRIPRERL